jgi:hypothetical protein
MRATRSRLLLALAAVLLAAGPARALGDEALEAGARQAERGLKRSVRTLAANRMQGRDNGSEGSRRAQAFLRKRLKRIGAELGAGDDPYAQPFQTPEPGTNLLALIPGAELPGEYVILGAHYDHLASCGPSDDPGDVICNGAADNAAGTAAALAVGRAIRKLREPLRRSVVIALWDAEEDDLAGSAHYVAEPLVPLAQTVAYVNLDLLGFTLTPSSGPTTFAVGSETGGAVLRAIVDAAARPPLDLVPLSYLFGQGRSDYANFGAAGVPIVFYGDGSAHCYHTSGDEIGLVDFEKLALQSAAAFRTVVRLAEDDPPPTFVAPSPAPTYDDAVSLQRAVDRAVPADLAIFPLDVQAELLAIQETVGGIVADGPGAFETPDAIALLSGAGVLVNRLEELPCPAF